MNDEWGEYELALLARQGDREALAELVERTRLRLFGLAYAELRHYEDAQDAVAAALLQVCRHIHELREPERVREWMNSIVRNEARRLRRKGPPLVSLDEADGHAREDTPSLLRLDIERALRQLPGDQARVSRLFYLADLSIDEIARRTGRPPGTIKSWLHRGRRRLALEMEEYAPMENDHVGAKLLASMGISLESIRNEVLQHATRGDGILGQDMQLTPQGKMVIDLAYAESALLGNNYIGTEHLVLGLIREGDGLAARVLLKLGADLERAREAVRAMQAA